MSAEPPPEVSRAAVIAGLRDLAAFLEAHPDVPVNDFQRIGYSAVGYPADGVNLAVAEVNLIAAALGVKAMRWGALHAAARWFGPVKYEAAAPNVYPSREKAEVAA